MYITNILLEIDCGEKKVKKTTVINDDYEVLIKLLNYI